MKDLLDHKVERVSDTERACCQLAERREVHVWTCAPPVDRDLKRVFSIECMCIFLQYKSSKKVKCCRSAVDL